MLANPHVDLTRKIRILWRPELYSIQQKYHLPEYKQKSKAFVQKKLVEKLPEMILNEQISQKLFERDYTQIAEEIRNYQNENSRVRCQEKVTYTSSNKKVAAVSKNGTITAKKNGTVKITVRSGRKSYVIKVKVK